MNYTCDCQQNKKNQTDFQPGTPFRLCWKYSTTKTEIKSIYILYKIKKHSKTAVVNIYHSGRYLFFYGVNKLPYKSGNGAANKRSEYKYPNR